MKVIMKKFLKSAACDLAVIIVATLVVELGDGKMTIGEFLLTFVEFLAICIGIEAFFWYMKRKRKANLKETIE